jgi:hypothetical protein
MLLKELLALKESTDEKQHQVIMDKMSGYMNDLVPEIDFDFISLDNYNREQNHYKGFFNWENLDNPSKHGKGTVEFSCDVHGSKVENINVYDLTGGFGVNVDQSIFTDKED